MKLASDEQHLMAAQLINQNHIRRVLRDVALPYSPREGSFLSGSCSPGEAKGNVQNTFVSPAAAMGDTASAQPPQALWLLPAHTAR